MELQEVTKPEQLEEYYKQEGLSTVEDKIRHLKEAMKIKAVRYEFGATLDDKLAGFEETVLYGGWRSY